MRKFVLGSALALSFLTSCTLSEANVVGTRVVVPLPGDSAVVDSEISGQIYAESGAAINNAGTLTVEDNVKFQNNSADAPGCGGAIYNHASGVAVIGDNVEFVGNSAGNAASPALSQGGAIQNNGDMEIGKGAIFQNNSALTSATLNNGGAIYNIGSLLIDDGALFSGNKAGRGGAIYNYTTGDPLHIGNSVLFENNTASAGYGGAIHARSGLILGDNVSFIGNKSIWGGGAIYSGLVGSPSTTPEVANKEIIIGDNAYFANNMADYNPVTGKTWAMGGAIQNEVGTIKIGDNAQFVSNTAANGGAISNLETLTLGKNATFANNYAATNGGAIFNTGTLTISGGLFSGNSAGDLGGAIYNAGTLNLDSTYGDIIFQNNTAGGLANDIHQQGGTLNVTGVNTVSLLSGLSGDSTSKLVKDGTGTLNLLGDNGLYKGLIEHNEGKINVAPTQNPTFEQEVKIKGPDTIMEVYGNSTFIEGLTVDKSTIGIFGNSNMNFLTIGSTINMIDNQIGSINVAAIPGAVSVGGTTTLMDNTNLNIDINPRNNTSDSLTTVNLITNGNTFDIQNVNFINAPISENFSAQVVDVTGTLTGDLIINVDPNATYETPIGYYRLFGSTQDGIITGTLTGFNPKVFRGQVATVAQYANQLAINSMLFEHVGVITNELISGNANKYASADIRFSPYQYSKKDGGVWLKTYGNFEKIRMSQDLTVGNNAYGALVGFDLSQRSLKKGWGFMPTAYAGYNGAHQYFSGVGMYQNGGQAGLMGTFDKGDFINTVLAYGGFYANQMNVANTVDTTTNWFWGVANKSAYNMSISRELVFQPTFLMSYNQFGRQEWGSDFGSIGMQSGMLNGFNVAPGANLIWSKESYSIYGMAQWMFNIAGSSSGQAGNISLPSVAMGTGYIEYGAGVTRKFKERLTTFLQGTIRNGTRNGVGVQLGFNWSL